MTATILDPALVDAERLNKSGSEADKTKLGDRVFLNRAITVKGKFDFSIDGGAQGDIALRDDYGNALKLPSGALVYNCLINCGTTFTSGGAAEVGMKIESAGDVIAANTAVADWDADVNTVTRAVLSANFITTAERTVYLTVATADLTDGVADFFIQYVETR